MGLDKIWAGMALLAAVSSTMTSVAEVPDLGVVLNLDGDDAYPHEELAKSTEMLRAEIDRYADAGIGTIVYSLGAGSEIMLYPTKVADTWGWRSTPYDDDPAWSARIKRNKANQEAGGDAIRTAGEQTKQHGMYFFPSLRMNDAHYTFGKPPEHYPLTGSFWLENRDLVIGQSPIRSKAAYGELLDFSHEKVRAHRMAQIFEAIDRYGDIMDGFEMDFTRFQVFFPPGTAEQRGHLLTGLVRQVRERLDELGEAHGRRYLLMTRIPPAPANCRWAGLEVEQWVEEGLVDVLVPSQMMTAAFDMPVDDFKHMTKDTDAQVYPTLLPRVGWRWDYEGVPVTDDLGAPTREITLPLLRGAALNRLDLGADGLYLFNFQHYPLWRGQPTSGPGHRAIVALSDPQEMARQDLRFLVTKAYWQDHEDSYQYRKDLPASLSPGDGQTFTLPIGIDPAERAASLRLGFREVKPGTRLSVHLNSREVFAGDLHERAVAAVSDGGEHARTAKARPDLALRLLELPLDASAGLRQGENEVTLSVSDTDAASEDGGSREVTLTDIEVGIAAP